MPSLKSHADLARQTADLLSDAVEENYGREPEDYEMLALSDAIETAEQLIETAGKVLYQVAYDRAKYDGLAETSSKLEGIAEAIRQLNERE